MKTLMSLTCVAMALWGWPSKASEKPALKAAHSIYDFTLKDIDGKEVCLGSYTGKVVMIVNVASKCGFTPQYTALEKLHRDYSPKGLRVLGFPCNDFGGQEPGSNQQIVQFCKLSYDVTFPLFDKLHTKGAAQHPLYHYLTGPTAPFPGDVAWNFEKFVIARDGTIAARFKSAVKPDAPELIAAIEKELAK